MRTVSIPGRLYGHRSAGQLDRNRALKLVAYVVVFGSGFVIGTSLLRHDVPTPPRPVTQTVTAPALEKSETGPFRPVGIPDPPRVAPPVITPGYPADVAAAVPPAASRKPGWETTPALPSVPIVPADRSGAPLGYRVQVGAFTVREYAQELRDQLRSHHYVARILAVATRPPYRVWIDGALDRAGAERLLGRLQRDGFKAVALKIDTRSCERVESNCAALATVSQTATPVRFASGATAGALAGTRSNPAVVAAAPMRPAIPGRYARTVQSRQVAPPLRLSPSVAPVAPARPPVPLEPIAAIQVAPGNPASILPGLSVGAAKLGATVADLTALFGNPTDSVRQADGSVTRWWFDASKQEGFGVRVTDNGQVDRLYLVNDARYRTVAGLAVGSTEPEVRMALGAPTVDIVTNSHKEILRYDPLGVWFEIQLDPKSDKYATVVQIDVLAPATSVTRRVASPARASEGGIQYNEDRR
jgi:cell division septation protein DedD